MKTVKVNLYNYNELSKQAKENAMNHYVNFLIDTMDMWEDDFIEEIEEAERLHTPWFLGQIIYQNNKNKLIKELESLGECFHSDGVRFNNK